MKIGILGAGAFGEALGGVLKRGGQTVYYYDPFKFPERELGDVLDFAEVILLATPAEVAPRVLRSFPEQALVKPLIVATKGVMDVGIYEKFRKMELISGPGFAKQLNEGKKIKLTVAGRGILSGGEARLESESEGGVLAERIFCGGMADGSAQITFDKTEDVAGVAMLSGLKNIFAIEAGRRRLEKNSEEFKEYILITLREAQKFLLFNGGFMETARLAAGVGDFVLTCGGEESRNYRFGKEFLRQITGRGNNLQRGVNPRKIRAEIGTVEGLSAAREIERLGLFVPRELEILPDILRRIKNAVE